MDMRCSNKLLGVILEPAPGGIVELRCKSVFCGSEPGVVVLHRFSTEDGKLLETKRFRDTPQVERNTNHGMGQLAPVRSA